MEFRLHQHQYVSVDTHVNFHHCKGKEQPYIISLNDEQMRNFHDVITVPSFTLQAVQYTPLGSGIWFHTQHASASLVNVMSGCFFRFFPSSWDHYKRKVHRRAYHYHGKSPSDQHRPHHDSKPLARFSASLLEYRQQRSTHGSTRNAHHSHEQWSQSPIVSRWKGANLWQSKTRRGGRDEAQSHREIEEDSTQPATISNEDCESSRECDFEECDSPPDYFLE